MSTSTRPWGCRGRNLWGGTGGTSGWQTANGSRGRDDSIAPTADSPRGDPLEAPPHLNVPVRDIKEDQSDQGEYLGCLGRGVDLGLEHGVDGQVLKHVPVR